MAQGATYQDTVNQVMELVVVFEIFVEWLTNSRKWGLGKNK